MEAERLCRWKVQMQENRQEQLEALEVMVEYNERLLKNLHIIVKELSGNRLEDTDKFLKAILEAINWEIQVVNGTMSLLNEKEERLDKASFNEAIVALNEAVDTKEDEKMAHAFEMAIPEFEKLGNVAKQTIQEG